DQSNDQNKADQPKSPKGAKQSKAATGSSDAAAADTGDTANNDAVNKDDGDAQDTQPKASGSKSPAKSARVQEARADSPREFSDAPVNQADSMIAGGDCNGAVRVLRAAGDNPRALTKLGAMYLTGSCVQPDRVIAYSWFSQAFNSDPHNLRLENTRRMIWSQMTDDERARVESGIGGR